MFLRILVAVIAAATAALVVWLFTLNDKTIDRLKERPRAVERKIELVRSTDARVPELWEMYPPAKIPAWAVKLTAKLDRERKQ